MHLFYSTEGLRYKTTLKKYIFILKNSTQEIKIFHFILRCIKTNVAFMLCNRKQKKTAVIKKTWLRLIKIGKCNGTRSSACCPAGEGRAWLEIVFNVRSDINLLTMFDCFSSNFLGLLSTSIHFATALICYKGIVAFYMQVFPWPRAAHLEKCALIFPRSRFVIMLVFSSPSYPCLFARFFIASLMLHKIVP